MVLELTRLNKYMSRFLAFMPLVFMFFMVAFNRMNRDYPAYQLAFWDLTFRDSLEFGYSFLVSVVDQMGGDQAAIAFIAGVLLLVIILRLLRTSNYINMVVFFYCSYPIIYDITQTRNFLMYLLALVSLKFVIENKPIKHYLVLALSFSMHSFALAYVPFYFLCKIDKRKFTKIMLSLTAVFIIASPVAVNVLSLIFPAEMATYLARTPGLGVLANYIYVALDILTVWWINKKISGKVPESEIKKMDVFYRFVWFPILIIPFSHLFLEIIRLERNVLLIKYVFCAMAMKYLNIKQRMVVIIVLVGTLILYLGFLKYTDQWDLIEYLDDNFIKYYAERYLF